MADTKISDLGAASALGGTEAIPAVQGGVNVRLTPAQLKTYMGVSGTNTGDQTITLTGDVTGSGTGSFAATIAANAVTFGKFVAASAAGIVGATAAGNFSNLTPTQATALLNAFTTSLAGLAPASGGGTTNFLRADGTWAAPSGGVQMNFAATADPVVGNDSSQGYAAGSVWMRSDTGDIWRCRSASVGAAKWVKMDLSDHPGYIASNWYCSSPTATAVAGAASGSGSLRLVPWFVKERITVSDLATRVQTASAGGQFVMGIYASNPTTKNPTGAALGSTAITLSTTTGSLVVSGALGSNVQLEAGSLYWLGLMTDNGTAAFQCMSQAGTWYGSTIGSSATANLVVGSASFASFKSVTGLTYASGLPDLTSATIVDTSSGATAMAPLINFKVVSVP